VFPAGISLDFGSPRFPLARHLVRRLYALLGPGGVLYGFLREPSLTQGA